MCPPACPLATRWTPAHAKGNEREGREGTGSKGQKEQKEEGREEKEGEKGPKVQGEELEAVNGMRLVGMRHKEWEGQRGVEEEIHEVRV